MGDGTAENPYTRDDVERKIEKHGGPQGLSLSEAYFEEAIDLRGLNNNNLQGIILDKAIFLLNIKRKKRDCPYRGADFRGVHLEGAHLRSTHLEEAEISDAYLDRAWLWHTHLEGAHLAGTHLEGDTNLRGAHLEGANLQSANLKGADLTGAYLEGAQLTDVILSSDTKLHNVDWGNYILAEERHGPLDWAEDTYRTLKVWHTEHGIYDIAGKFFYREMEAKRKLARWKRNFWLKLWYSIVRILAGYGEKPYRVAISAAAVVLTAALVYFLAGWLFEWSAFGRSLYFSVVSFTALGYGDWVHLDSNLIRGLGAAESILGVFMMALFLVTFTRKMTR